MIIIIIVFLFSIFMGYRYFEDKKETTSKDAVTFKKEYEALNNRVNPNNKLVTGIDEVLQFIEEQKLSRPTLPYES